MADIDGPDIEGLYREHRAGLVRLVERELHDRQDAEDVVQTAFLDAQRALTRGTIPHNPRAWLAAIALNAARRLWRREVNVQALEEYAAQEASRLPEIKAALSDLPKNEQAVVLYCDLLGLSYAEMAEQMGMTVPSVTMLLHRARYRLRGLLGIGVVGVGLWRWLRSSTWQATAAKAAGVVVLAGGLTTAGVVTAEHAVRATAPAAAGSARAAPQLRREFADIRANTGVVHRRASRARRSSSLGRVPTEQSSAGAAPTIAAAAPAAVQASSGLPVLSQAAAAVPSVPSAPLPTLSVPALSAPTTLPTPALPTATATITTPVATATVAVPTGTTTTLTTPIATVTVNVP